MRCFRAIIAATLLVATPVRGEHGTHVETPAQLSRVLKTFDFEERERGNVEDTPAGWLKIEGPGLPHYLRGTFDADVHASGKASFRLDLNGGSITYRYPAGQIPVMAHATYRVSTMVRTTTLRAARARLTAYLCDADGHPLGTTLKSTEPVANAPGDGDFYSVSVDITADAPTAASLVLELSLLQPSLLPDDNLGDQKLLVEDIHGSAWFDDVRVAQVPSVSLTTDHPTNVFTPGETVKLRVGVIDRIAADLSADLRVVDVNGQPVFQRTGAIDFTGGDSSRGEELVGTASLPSLPPGWYEARLAVSSRGQSVAQRTLKFVRTGEAPIPSQADPRFGVVATSLDAPAWSALPEALADVAAGRVKISAWSATTAIENNAAAAFDRLLDALRPDGRSVTACLTALPPELQKLVGGDRWTDLLQVPTDRWQPQLAYLIARHATHIDQWQFMSDDAADEVARDPKRLAVFNRVFSEFEKLTGTSSLALPWPAFFDREPAAPGASSIVVPTEVLPEQIPLYVRDARAAAPERMQALSLTAIPRSKYGRPAQLRDLALRVVYGLVAGVDRIDLPLPFASTTLRDGTTMLEPDPTLIAQRTTFATLSNARFAGKIQIAPGVDAFLFDRNGSGVMLISTPSTAPIAPVGRISIALGKRATRVELDGSTSPIPHVKAKAGRPDDFDLEIGAMPFFVTDIDAPLMLLRASVAIDNPMLESSVTPVGRQITFRNSFGTPITGSIRVAAPQGWQVQASGASFSLNPGETCSVPISLTFPTSASSGDKVLTADIKLQGRDDYRLIVPIAVKLGLSDVGLQTLAVRSGDDIIVQQVITNYGSKPINYNAFVTIAGLPRQERIVSNLPPGKVTIRKYRLSLPASSLAEKLRSGVREVEGKRMLNDEVEIR